MLKIIDSKDVVTVEEARKYCVGGEVLVIDFDFDTKLGKVYAISTSSDTACELQELQNKFEVSNVRTATLGCYVEGYRTGILHEI